MTTDDRHRVSKLSKWLNSVLQRDANLAARLGRELLDSEKLLPELAGCMAKRARKLHG